jgi:hypothetical protein
MARSISRTIYAQNNGSKINVKSFVRNSRFLDFSEQITGFGELDYDPLDLIQADVIAAPVVIAPAGRYHA